MAVFQSGTGQAISPISALVDTPTFTISSASGLVLGVIVGWTHVDATSNVSSVVWDPTGVNQAASSLAAAVSNTLTGGIAKVQGFKLINPTPGASKIARVNFSVQPSVDCGIWAVCCSGVDQTTGISDWTTGSGNSPSGTGSETITVTNVVTGDVVMDLKLDDGSGTNSVGANQTVVNAEFNVTSVYNSSRKSGVNGGAMSWTIQFGPHAYIHGGLRFINGASIPPGGPLLMLGVG